MKLRKRVFKDPQLPITSRNISPGKTSHTPHTHQHFNVNLNSNNCSQSQCIDIVDKTSKKRFFILVVFVLVGISIIFIFVLTKGPRRKYDPLTNKPPTYSNATFFESRGESLRFKCNLKAGAGARNKKQERALARVIPFQSNAANQLQNFMAYYSQVIGVENIVIIDHQTNMSNSDVYTASLLDKYNAMGSDIWQCEGDFKFKSEMWSWVIHRYKDKSEFVFPLDIDEYIAVLNPIKSNPKALENEGGRRNSEVLGLSWNKEDLSNLLHSLPNTEKPFKIEGGNVYPVDCGNDPFVQKIELESVNMEIEDTGTSSSKETEAGDPLLNFDVGAIQKIKYVARRKDNTGMKRCMDKAFMRGNEFNFTDTGNHYGQTHKVQTDNLRERCKTEGSKFVLPEDESSGLFMIHVQFTNFEEWLMHALRGASDRRFNRFMFLQKCVKGMTSLEYCENWRLLMKTKFDPREMKKEYRHGFCRELSNRSKFDLLPISQLMMR